MNKRQDLHHNRIVFQKGGSGILHLQIKICKIIPQNNMKLKNMCKKAIILVAVLMFSIPAIALADGTPATYPQYPQYTQNPVQQQPGYPQQYNQGFTYSYQDPFLVSLTHNCPNTGKMLPEKFDPNVTTYILTVANWVSRVRFTPVASSPDCVVRVNGEVVLRGGNSSYTQMTDNPKQVIITVTNPAGQTKTYTIFLQRRPSERRTKVSAGYINEIYSDGGKWYIDADLVTVNYKYGNISSFRNYKQEHYKYACTDECVFYTGTMVYPKRAKTITEFMSNYDTKGLYRIIYIEDTIVAVMPYSSDY